MGELSLGFHLMSLVVLMALLVWVVRLQTMINLWRTWAQPTGQARYMVAEPVRSLRQFACATGAAFESEIPVNAVAAGKVSLGRLFDLHKLCGVNGIEVSSGSPVTVCFVLRQEPSTITEEIAAITRDLGGNLQVKVRHQTS